MTAIISIHFAQTQCHRSRGQSQASVADLSSNTGPSIHVGFVVDRMVQRQFCLGIIRVSTVSIIPQILYYRPYIRNIWQRF
jgi:hypothetical protein